jgi:transcriptional regulator with XRE-family HTH domain
MHRFQPALWTSDNSSGKMRAMTITSIHDDPAAMRLETARQFMGLSMSKVERRVIALLGDDSPTQQTLRNYHHHLPPQPNILVLAALCTIYGIKLSDLGIADASASLERARDLLNRTPACLTVAS